MSAPLVILVVAVALCLRAALATTRAVRSVRRLGAPSKGVRAGRVVAPTVAAPTWLTAALADAAVEVDPGTVWCGSLASLALVAVVGAMVGGPLLALLAPTAAALAGVVGLESQRGRRDAAVDEALPAALEALARALRSGASLRQAIGEAAAASPPPLADELALVASQVARGVPLVAAIDELPRRRPRPGVRLAAAALAVGAETGGAQARAVDGVAATVRDRLAAAAEVRALSAQTRASVVVIAVAPLAFCAFAASTDPRSAQFLFRTSLGLAFVSAGLILDGLSLLWMRRLARVPA